ncbi:MAG TPA: hypothetical protein DCQ64_17580 [Candidatus Rokubacteria bacterium]|nr:hypothetical protein [Candidatus Rokubacteria bacterium]
MLTDRFTVPPFSVLDARQGYWRARKAEWRAFGVRGEEGRREDLLGGGINSIMSRGGGLKYDRKNATATSVFDPVLCELIYRWFCPPEGSVLDPFAGESTKGIVAAALRLRYVGVELRPEQVAANEERVREIGPVLDPRPAWTVGDSSKLGEIVPMGLSFDLVFTSPPYYDLEVYSKRRDDGSAMPTYEDFMAWYLTVFRQAAERLLEGRFLVIKVGEIRDERGAQRGFVADNIKLFQSLGFHLYNEAVYVTPLGSVPVRASRHFPRRLKLERAHQAVLVFYKGDPRRAPAFAR